MVSVIVEKPYKFIPPHRGTWWPSFVQALHLFDPHLRKKEGVVGYELRHTERLMESLRANCGILLAPNHCRYADPLVMGWLARRAKTHIYAMASWHLFHMGAFNAFAIQKMGAFSLFREGMDRQSIEMAIEVIATADRPLMLFPEGATFRANDHLQPLLDGVSFIARTASRRRKKHVNERVVIHPIGIKYVFQGNIQNWAAESLNSIETTLGWQTQSNAPLGERIRKAADALLALREVEYGLGAQSGDLYERSNRLVNHILEPLQQSYPIKETDDTVLNRVKALRTKILPALIELQDENGGKEPLRRALRDLDLAQKIDSFPAGYLAPEQATETRLIETLENIEESLFGKPRWPGPLKVIIETGEAIDVPAAKAPRGETDPIVAELSANLEDMLQQMSTESKSVDLNQIVQ